MATVIRCAKGPGGFKPAGWVPSRFWCQVACEQGQKADEPGFVWSLAPFGSCQVVADTAKGREPLDGA